MAWSDVLVPIIENNKTLLLVVIITLVFNLKHEDFQSMGVFACLLLPCYYKTQFSIAFLSLIGETCKPRLNTSASLLQTLCVCLCMPRRLCDGEFFRHRAMARVHVLSLWGTTTCIWAGLNPCSVQRKASPLAQTHLSLTASPHQQPNQPDVNLQPQWPLSTPVIAD